MQWFCTNQGFVMKSYKTITFFVCYISSEVLVVFNTSFSHSNTNLPIIRFSHEQFSISKY